MREPTYESRARTISSDVVLFENRYRQRFSCPKHFHETYQIEIVREGAKRVFINHRYQLVQRGVVVFVAPGEVHAGGCADEGELVCHALFPEPSIGKMLLGASFEGNVRAEHSPVGSNSFVCYDTAVAMKFNYLFNNQHWHRDDCYLKEVYQQVLLALLFRNRNDVFQGEHPARYREFIQRAKECINDQLSQSLSVDDIAKAVYMSPYHFLRVFKSYTGITLHQYILSLKIERSKIILKQNGICTTYRMLGFKDQAHFTKVFKKITGLTPGQYIKIVN